MFHKHSLRLRKRDEISYIIKIVYDNPINHTIKRFMIYSYVRKRKVGYIKGVIDEDQRRGNIYLLFVNPVYRKRGIANLLLEKCLSNFGIKYDFTLLACPVSKESNIVINYLEAVKVLLNLYGKYGFLIVDICEENENELSYYMIRNKGPLF
jgi:ribosomal protein S18 acetylase RimI-like enzyme